MAALSQDLIDEIVRRVLTVCQPVKIILFGSAARGDMGPDSDVDLLVVDRAREPQSGSIVIAVVDGELTVKRLRVEKKRVRLVPENPAYRPIEVGRGTDVVVWGVVAHAIRSY